MDRILSCCNNVKNFQFALAMRVVTFWNVLTVRNEEWLLKYLSTQTIRQVN